MALLFFRGRNRLLLWRNTLRLLRPAPEVVVQARNLPYQGILICRETLNSYGVLNIRPQSFIKLGHFGAFILLDSRRILRKPSQVLGYRGVLF
jgi:hypothetical protein